MSKRGGTLRAPCASSGCREVGWYDYESQRDLTQLRSDLARHPYACYRHRAPDEVLSETNRERLTVLTVVARDDISGKHFFDGQHGIVSGPGFRAIAADWPAGTQLVVAARVLVSEADAFSGGQGGGDNAGT